MKPQNPEPAEPKTQASLMRADPIKARKARKAKKPRKHRPAARAVSYRSPIIPADAVTRQSGKISSDAVIVTLQKSTSTAVCFYTLKAYVGKKLTTIAACTVHR